MVNHDFRAPHHQISSLESEAQENYGDLTKKLESQDFLIKLTTVNPEGHGKGQR